MQKIYLMKNDFGLYKVGISKNPKKRASDISNNSGVPTEVVCSWDAYQAYRTEQYIHKHFSGKRTKGEWFRFSKKDIGELPKVINSVDPLIPHKSVDPTDRDWSELLPCQNVFSLLTKPKVFKNIKDLQGILDFQYKLLKTIFDKNQNEFENIMGVLKRLGFHVDYLWAVWSLEYGDFNPLTCGFMQNHFPICTKAEQLMASIVCEEEFITYYEDGIKQKLVYIDSLKEQLAELEK